MKTLATALFVASQLIAVGCAGMSEDDEDDAAAAAGGKADEFGLSFDIYNTDKADAGNLEFRDKEPVILALHAPDGKEAEGETGHFDLARYDDDISDTEHLAGTFKLYTYRGRNRIRFTSYEGRELWKSDWTKEGRSIAFPGFDEDTSVSPIGKLPEELVDCLVVDVLDGEAFEEGLTTYEYPTVGISKEGSKYEMDLGAAGLDSDDGTITVIDNAEKIEAKGTYSDSGQTFIIRVPKQGPRRGEVLQVEGREESTVATIACH